MLEGLNTISNFNSNLKGVKGKSTLGKDDFMNLMIQQLKFQDPMNPMNGSEFAAQLAQFSSLEQLSNIKDSLNSSIEANFQLTQSINNTMTAALIGKEAKINGSTFEYSGQDEINFGFKLNEKAKSVSIKIYDKDNVLIKTLENLPNTSGEHKLSWDFTDNNGSKVSKGEYHFEVDAKDLNDKKLTVSTYTIGTINAVRFTDNGTKIVVDGAEYNLSDILEILKSNT